MYVHVRVYFQLFTIINRCIDIGKNRVYLYAYIQNTYYNLRIVYAIHCKVLFSLSDYKYFIMPLTFSNI